MDISPHIDFTLDALRRIHDSDRWFSSGRMADTCRTVEEIMDELGMTGIETRTYPADGRTDFGGWLMPLSWDAEEATLEIVSPETPEPLLCRYTEFPCSLMLYSRPADFTATVVFAEDAATTDIHGKFVFANRTFPGLLIALDWLTRGAAGIVSSVLCGNESRQPGFEYLRDCRQWCNYTLPLWHVEGNPVGFSLTPREGEKLEALLRKNPGLQLKANVRTRLYSGELPMVTALLPGETDGEIILTGHLFEQGANDNASGIALSLGILRAMLPQKRRRGIRVFFTYEARSFQAYLRNAPETAQMTAGLNMDMVGVSMDKVVTLGSNRPVFPHFADALLKDLFRKHPDYTVRETDFGTMDNSPGEPLTGVPLPYLLLGSDPNYHKSGDVPERIDPAVLRTIGDVALEYVNTLVNAGYSEARELAFMTYRDEEKRIAALPANKQTFALELAGEALNSTRLLLSAGDSDNAAALARFTGRLHRRLLRRFPTDAYSAIAEEPGMEILRRLVPLKLFRGFFSFEKYLSREEEFPKVRRLFHGWNADAWVNYALMWSDGRRSAAEIYRRLKECGKFKGSPEQLSDLLEFMSAEGYLSLKKI